MMDGRTDPQGADEIWRAKLETATLAFQRGDFPMTEPVYRATLFGLGFRRHDIDFQVNAARTTMTRYTAAIAKLPLPPSVRALPVDRRGYPVPKFVAWVDGEPDFRLTDPAHIVRCVFEHACWVCGRALEKDMAFVCGPSAAITARTTEPPSHVECAEFALAACPFIMNPNRTRGLPIKDFVPAESVTMTTRNPGCWLLWVTDEYEVRRHGDALSLKMGRPSRMEWRCRGGVPTRAQAIASLETGVTEMRRKAAAAGPMRAAAKTLIEHALGLALEQINAALPEEETP